MEKYTVLAAANSDLQKKVSELKTVSAECESLKSTQNDRHQELILEMAELKKYGKTDESVIGSDIEQGGNSIETNLA